MSFDISRQMYTCWRCEKLPCECMGKVAYKALEMLEIPCSKEGCVKVFDTMNAMMEHHLVEHEDKRYMVKVDALTFNPTTPSTTNGVYK